MFSTVSRYPSGDDFAPFRDEVSQYPGVLIIDFEGLISAEAAHLPLDIDSSLLVHGLLHSVILANR